MHTQVEISSETSPAPMANATSSVSGDQEQALEDLMRSFDAPVNPPAAA